MDDMWLPAPPPELTGYAQQELLAMSIFDSQLDSDFAFQRDKWPAFSRQSRGHDSDRPPRDTSHQNDESCILTIVPGLHAAAIAPVLDAGN